MPTKIKMTVTEALNNDVVFEKYSNVMLTLATTIEDDVSLAFCRAFADLSTVDTDNENAFETCAYAFRAAEVAFLASHKNTVVAL